MATTANLFPVVPDQAGMDDESYELALKIMLEDARQNGSQSNAKGKQREGTISDRELAFNIYAQELETVTTLISDRRISQGLQNALRTDFDAISRHEGEERMALHDHNVALALAQGRDPPPPPAPQEPTRQNTQQSATFAHYARVPAQNREKKKQSPQKPIELKRAASTIEELDNDDEDPVFLGKRLKTGESSSWAASRQLPAKKSAKRACTSCMDDIPETQLVRAPCSHEYCHQCLRSLVRSAMRDESLFPPQCCRQAIPADKLSEFLDESLMSSYHEKKIEFATENRMYCHKPDCAAFILPALIEDDTAFCLGCGATTCIHCKKSMHPGDCPFDQELQRVLQIGQQQGWRRCHKCSTMVELNQGCFHMTCRCRAEFCYSCGSPWKTCQCQLWEEGRIIDRAAEIDQRRHGPNEDPQQGERIDRILDHLRGNQDCDHRGEWRRLRGQHICEGCRHVLPHYIYECSGCQIVACRQCRLHRF